MMLVTGYDVQKVCQDNEKGSTMQSVVTVKQKLESISRVRYKTKDMDENER